MSRADPLVPETVAHIEYPFTYLEEFRRYEMEARGNGRGLWK